MSHLLTVLDLFSGIGGFSLGLESTGGFRTVAFCEIEPFPRAVLRKHWPDVPIHEDVRTLTADTLAMILSRHGKQNEGGNGEACDTSTDQAIRGGGGDVRQRAIGGRCGEVLRDLSSSDVGRLGEAGSEDALQDSRRAEEQVLSRRFSRKRSSAKHAGDGHPEGSDSEANGLPGVRGESAIQGRTDGDSGTPSGLQQTSGGDVALPAMSPRLAQEAPSDSAGREVARELIDVIVGGFP